MVGYQADLRRLTANSNVMLLGVVVDLADHYSGGPRPAWTAAEITERAEAFGATLVSQRNTFIGNNADALMRTLRADSARRTQGAA